MRLDSRNPWLTQPSHSGIVRLSTHKLWASVSGPIRLPNAPLLIFITGAAASCAVYVKLQDQLSEHCRVLFYNRAGYDRSTLPPPKSPEGGKDILAQETAQDLAALLKITQLKPPYILVGHSFGGIPARCFLALKPKDVAGMILLDCATEIMLAMHKRCPPLELESLGKNVDYEAITHLREESGMTQEQWDYAMEAQGRTLGGIHREDTHAGADRLAHEHQFEKQIMGTAPLTVLRFHATQNLQVIYDAAVANGDGTEEERRIVREYIERFGLYHDQIERAQLRLSKNSEFRYYGDIGHDLPIRRPAIVVEEVKKLLGRIKAHQSSLSMTESQ